MNRRIPIRGQDEKPKLWSGRSLRDHGTNPYGDNLWRVVWGPSRLYMVGGVWEDRDGEMPTTSELYVKQGHDSSIIRRALEYRWIPKYPACWVLEKWLSPIQYAGSPAVWQNTQASWPRCMSCEGTGKALVIFTETNLSGVCTVCGGSGENHFDGPILTLGPYPSRGEYEACYHFPEEPTFSMITGVIDMLVYGANYTPAERRAAIEAVENGKKWDWRNKCEAIFKDSQGAFNNAPSNVNPAKRTADKVRLDVSAEELNMPTGENKFFMGGDANLEEN